MNLFKKIFFFFILFLFNITLSLSAEKTVFIDIDFVLNNSNIGKSIYKELDKINKDNLNLLNTKEKILKEKKDSIEKTKNVSSKEKLQNDIGEFNNQVNLFKKEKNKLSNEFKLLKKNKLDKFLKDINPLIEEYMKKNSIDIILEKNQIFVGNKNNDITLDIIELINKRLTND